MNEEQQNAIARAYREAVFPLLSFTVEELEEWQKICREDLERFQSLAPILAPAEYFTKRDNGELHFAEVQAEVAGHLIAARRAIQKLGPGGVLGLAQKVMIERAEDELSDSD